MGQVAAVVTVLNEQDTVTDLIQALKQQTLPPTRVIIVDGGSADGTFTVLQKQARAWPALHVYRFPGNRSQGRNFGVSKSTQPIIAFTDAGCIPDDHWLEELIRPFTRSDVSVVSGFYRGQASGIFEKCLIPYVLVMPNQADKTEFFPSSRSMALRRAVWNKSGGFNPKVDPSEDFELAHRLKSLGFNFTFAPQAQVSWTPRKNLSQTAWMFLKFAYGDIQAGILRPKVKLLAARYLIFLYAFFLALQIHLLFIPLAVVAGLYLVWSVKKNYRYVSDWRAVYWLPILQITADMAVLFGTLMGLLTYQKPKIS